MLLVYNPDGEGSNCWFRVYGADAKKCQDLLDTEILNLEQGDTYHAYMAFIDQETGQVSDSVYAGAVVMQGK